MKLAKRMSSFAPSATMAISGKVTELQAQGKNIIGFSAGEPDFDVPDFIKEAAIKAIRDGYNKYTPVPGNDAIKTAVIEFMKSHYGIDYRKNEVILSCGAKHSLYNITQVLFEEGDEVIVFSPYWVTYPDQIQLAGATPVILDCDAKNDFNPDIDKLKSSITARTRAIILNSPGNPSGAVYSEETIRAIAKIVVEKDLLLISDEIYDQIVYDGAKVLAPATISEEVKKRTLVVNGFSKTFSMTGWRLGFTVGRADIISAMNKIQGQCTSNPATPLQFGGVAALSDLSFIPERVAKFKERRDQMVDALNAMQGVSCNVPKGAFYAFADFSGWIGKTIDGIAIKDDLHLTELLIEKAGIAPVPGSAFGSVNFLRFSYAMDTDEMNEGMARLRKFCDSLK
ncbi:MAG: pyridoxal phosphate-dependent aminotransferase [Nitrospinota bacterium]|nr:pyridoxal phosphate-dependent aminotransferase [Nitrospinota bacterium]